MSKLIQVAIVGCGSAGTRQAEAFARCGAEVRWAVDTDLARAAALQRLLKTCRTSTDYREALDDADLDVVAIAVPPHLRAPVATATVRAWKHVLAEQPLATSLAEADRVLEATEESGAIVMLVEPTAFDPLYQDVSHMLQAGNIGQPVLIQLAREACLDESFLKERPWLLDSQTAGGAMLLSGVHDVALLRRLAGEVAGVQALRARQRLAALPGDDTSIALLRFRGGAVGTLLESIATSRLATAMQTAVHSIRLDGDRGSLSVGADRVIRVYRERMNSEASGALIEERRYVPPADTAMLAVQHFLDCIRTGQEPLTSGRQQRRSLEIVLAAYRSMDTGETVNL